MKAIRSSALLVLCAIVMSVQVATATQARPEDLDRFVGDYELVTSDSVTITRREGTLFGQLNAGNPVSLTLTDAESMTLGRGWPLWLKRTENGLRLRDMGDTPPWVAIVIVGLLVWRVAYAIRTARRSRSVVSRWTDPWMLQRNHAAERPSRSRSSPVV